MANLIGERRSTKKMNDYISSRQSQNVVGRVKKYKHSTYADMLLQDLTASYSIYLSPKAHDAGFYFVEPPKDNLEKLLSFRSYRWLENDLEDMLIKISYYLILNGRAYVEIATWKKPAKETDQNGEMNQDKAKSEEIVGISLEPIPVERGVLVQGRYRFYGQDYKGNSVSFRVEKKNIICFDLKDMRIRRGYFLRLFKRLGNIDVLKATSYAFDSKLKEKHSFNDHIKKNDYLLLKYTKRLHWYGRNPQNQQLSESYLSFRAAHFMLWRKSFLDYLIMKLNDGIKRFSEELHFKGRIKVKDMEYDYQKKIEDYNAGKINAEELAKDVFC